MEITDKICLITGGSKGLGRSLAILLSGQGAKTIICSRHKNDLEKVCNFITKKGHSCEYFVADVCKETEVNKLITQIKKKFGGLDILINNAGTVTKYKKIDEVPIEDYQKTLLTNLFSVFLLIRKTIPIMKNQKSGLIVNISSRAGKVGHGGLSPYSASKFGVLGLTQSVGWELQDTGVSCFAVCPNGINTSMRRRLFGVKNAVLQQTPEQVAGLIIQMIQNKIIVPNGGDISIRDGKITELNNPLKAT